VLKLPSEIREPKSRYVHGLLHQMRGLLMCAENIKQKHRHRRTADVGYRPADTIKLNFKESEARQTPGAFALNNVCFQSKRAAARLSCS